MRLGAVNTVSLALFLLACAAIALLALAAPRRPRLPQLCFLFVAAFLLINKVWSPQYVIWLAPLVVLARPRLWSYGLWAYLITITITTTVGPRAAAGPDSPGTTAVLYLIASPAGFFLAAGYTEALFLAFALTAWLASRRGRWPLAALLAGGASFIRLKAIFLVAALVTAALRSPAGWDGDIPQHLGGRLRPRSARVVPPRSLLLGGVLPRPARDRGGGRGCGHDHCAGGTQALAGDRGHGADHRRAGHLVRVPVHAAGAAAAVADLVLAGGGRRPAGLGGQLYLAVSVPVAVAIGLLFMNNYWAG